MKVWLNIVGGQFGAWIDVPMAQGDNNGPSVAEVLKAAEGVVAADNEVKFVEATLEGYRGKKSIKMLMLEVPDDGVKSRKKNANGSARKKVAGGTLILKNSVGFEEFGRSYTRAFQYYIEKARRNPPLTTTTFSIDDVIVPSSHSDEKVVIEDGDTVTIRLIVVAQPTIEHPE